MPEASSVAPSHEGRVALVTGAAGGLGQAICRGLAERGATVVGVDLLDQTETADVVQGAGATWHGITADVTSQSAVSALAEDVRARFGRCDILVNNAGIADAVPWDALDYDLWQKILRVNLDGQFLMAKAVVPLMKAQAWGRIVNIVSTTVVMPLDIFVAYRVSKMGVIGLTRSLAALGEHGITANAVSPSLTPTGMTEGTIPDEVFEAYRQSSSIKRTAETADVVPTVVFLTSPDAYWVTGQSFAADGGQSFCLP
jgi:NAD(P)-dependent dehydrogenase (short-subunit alcohol dehydrogenase family)